MGELLKWDQIGEHYYETGIDKVVAYPAVNPVSGGQPYSPGEAWNGVTGVTQSPSGAEPTKLYANNAQYLNLMSVETLGLTVTAYTAPDSFDAYDGKAEIAPGVKIAQQSRKPFGLSYRTKIGNDTDGQDHGETIHLVYGCLASPSEKAFKTINESPEAPELSWSITTTPVEVPGFQKTSLLEVSSLDCDPEKFAALKAILWGTAAVEADSEHGVEAAEAIQARLPLPDEVARLVGTQG